MQRITFILFAMLLVADAVADSECAQAPAYMSRNAKGETTGIFLDEQALLRIPEWAPGQGDSPVSQARAGELAVAKTGRFAIRCAYFARAPRGRHDC